MCSHYSLYYFPIQASGTDDPGVEFALGQLHAAIIKRKLFSTCEALRAVDPEEVIRLFIEIMSFFDNDFTVDRKSARATSLRQFAACLRKMANSHNDEGLAGWLAKVNAGALPMMHERADNQFWSQNFGINAAMDRNAVTNSRALGLSAASSDGKRRRRE